MATPSFWHKKIKMPFPHKHRKVFFIHVILIFFETATILQTILCKEKKNLHKLITKYVAPVLRCTHNTSSVFEYLLIILPEYLHVKGYYKKKYISKRSSTTAIHMSILLLYALCFFSNYFAYKKNEKESYVSLWCQYSIVWRIAARGIESSLNRARAPLNGC